MGTLLELDGVDLLARKLEQDISLRGLRTGDRYRTANEAALLLGVSSATAHRAMCQLVRRQVLVRHRGRGTFVGPAVADAHPPVRLKTVAVLFPDAQRDISAFSYDAIVESIRRQVPGAGIQLHFVPPFESIQHVRAIIGALQSTRQYAGCVPISCSREVYRYLGDAGGAVVVIGSLFPDQRHLPSVDLDYRQAGYLLAKFLCERGHRRVALLAAGAGRPGDAAAHDGVAEALTEAGRPSNALVLRVYAGDLDAFRAQVGELLAAANRPTGLICGGERLLAVVESLVRQMGLTQEVELVYDTLSKPGKAQSPYVHVRPRHTFEEIAAMVAGMLATQIKGQPPEERHVVIPVELARPEVGADGS